jgi:hypothetical protein
VLLDFQPRLLSFAFSQGERKAAFTFDRVFSPESTQEEVYEFSAKPIVEGENF